MLLLGLVGTVKLTNIANKSDLNTNSLPINPAKSSDINNPEILFNDAEVFDNFTLPGITTYYYATDLELIVNNYWLIWMYQIDFPLTQYSLNIYSNYTYLPAYLIQGCSGVHQLEWLVCRPPTTQTIYIELYSMLMTGNYCIEAECSTQKVVSSLLSYNVTLNPIDRVAIYHVLLDSGLPYSITLDVPSGCDFDIEVFWMTPNLDYGPDKRDHHVSNSSTLGQDESVSFTAEETEHYAIVMSQKAGSGIAVLRIEQSDVGDGGIPGFEILPILMLISIVIWLQSYKRKRPNFL